MKSSTTQSIHSSRQGLAERPFHFSLPLVMSRLGLAGVTAIMTVVSAFMSLAVAGLLNLVFYIPNADIHLSLAFIIPFFVTPPFSCITALTMRSIRRERRAARYLADHDHLTSLPNRRMFFDVASHGGNQRNTDTSAQALLYVDIDHFKSINDRFGHEGGDAALKHFARLLKSNVRETDLVARIGGEEFAIWLKFESESGLALIAQRILTACRNDRFEYNNQMITFTVSIGGAMGNGLMPIDNLLRAADRELYAVKSSGRNNFRIRNCIVSTGEL